MPALIVHGWQDYNVRQSEGIDLFAQQDSAAWLYMFQGAHESPGSHFQPLLDTFFAHTLKGRHAAPPVTTEGTDGVFREHESWPPPGTTTRTIELPEGESTESGASTEETGESYHVTRAPGKRPADRGRAGAARHGQRRRRPRPSDADARRRRARRHDHADHAGFLNLRYRNGLEREEPVPVNTPVTATVTFSRRTRSCPRVTGSG